MPGKLVFAYVTYSLLMIVYSAINVPYCALGAVLTPDWRERVSLNGYRFFLATAGGAPYYEDDAWFDISEWLDGNDYNPTDEIAGKWDDETYDWSAVESDLRFSCKLTEAPRLHLRPLGERIETDFERGVR
jgi:hypothetical protein